MWYLASVVYADHVDVVLADVQMCSVLFRSCDNKEDDDVPWLPVLIKIKMAARVKSQFCSQIFLKMWNFITNSDIIMSLYDGY